VRNVFAARLTTHKEEAKIDIRRDLTCDIEPYDLPRHIDDKIRRLMSRLQLRFGAIDMRMNPRGEFYFLEINPIGQYLHIEVMTHQPITSSLAALLAGLHQ